MGFSRGFICACLAGVLGAVASVGAKLALSAEEAIHRVCVDTLDTLQLHTEDTVDLTCATIAGTIRLGCVGVLVLSNILMWLTFVKSLQYCSSSVEATVTNTAVNFFTSGVFGNVLFGESLPALWWCGSVLIILGLLSIHKGTTLEGVNKDKRH